jgi:hypothetical protein
VDTPARQQALQPQHLALLRRERGAAIEHRVVSTDLPRADPDRVAISGRDLVGARPWNTARLVKLMLARRGIRRLPTTPAESTDSLAADSVLLGSALIHSVLAVRESEIELFAEAPAEEVVQALRWTH